MTLFRLFRKTAKLAFGSFLFLWLKNPLSKIFIHPGLIRLQTESASCIV